MKAKHLILLLAVSVTHPAVGQDFPQPKKGRIVHDFAELLDEREERALERKLVAMNDTTSVQIAVITIGSLGGYDVAEYNIKLSHLWGIGQAKEDNGISILIARDDRRVNISTGYGVEEFVTDALSRRIIDQYMVPEFRNGHYYAGLDAGTDVLIGLVNGQFDASQLEKPKGEQKVPAGVIFVIVLIIVFVFVMASRGGRGGGRGGGRRRSVATDALLTAFLLSHSGRSSWGGGGGGFGGGGFGGFGGGGFGGGGASGSW